MAGRRFKPEPPIYRFRVRILGGFYAPEDCRSISREIEVAANQTLADLGEAIPLAFDFDDPHMWSFFLSGKAWDKKTEYAIDPGDDPFAGLLPPGPEDQTPLKVPPELEPLVQALAQFLEERGADGEDEAERLASEVLIRDVPYPGATGKKEFLFLFDYGDEWHFGVKLLGTSPIVELRARYPRVVASVGTAPPQYPNLDDEDWDDEEWDEEDEDEQDEAPPANQTPGADGRGVKPLR